MRRGGRRLGGVRAAGGILGLPSFSPAQIAGLYAWYIASRGVTQVAGPKVSAWDDQAGNNQGLTQATDANRPGYTSSSSNFRGQPTVDFGASGNQVLKAAAAADWKFLHDGGGFTAFFVFRPTSAGVQQFLWQTNEGSGANVGAAIDYNGTNAACRLLVTNGGAAIVNHAQANATCPVNGAPHIVIARYLEGRAGFEYDLQADDTTAVSGNSSAGPSAANPTSPLGVGALSGATLGLISASVATAGFFNRFLSDAERGTLKAYLRTTFGTV